MNTTSNGQSAAKLLNTIVHEEGSTTISRKESTLFKIVEKVGVLLYKFNDKIPNVSCIYGIYCESNNKLYVGSCIDLHARIIRHRSYLKRKVHHSKKLQNCYNKHGIETFKVIILENINNSIILAEKEELWIKKLDSFNNGLNCTDRCVKYSKFKLTSEQIKKRIAKSSKAVICLDLEGNYMCEYSSLSSAAKAVKDQSTNISSCCRGIISYVKDCVFVYKTEYDSSKDYSYKGRKYIVTDTHRQNLSRALKNKQGPKTLKQLESLRNRCSVPIEKYDLENNLLKQYSSMKECRKENKIEQKKLRKIIDSQTPTGGFLYKECKNIV